MVCLSGDGQKSEPPIGTLTETTPLLSRLSHHQRLPTYSTGTAFVTTTTVVTIFPPKQAFPSEPSPGLDRNTVGVPAGNTSPFQGSRSSVAVRRQRRFGRILTCVEAFFDQLYSLVVLFTSLLALATVLFLIFRPRAPDFDVVDVSLANLKVRTAPSPSFPFLPWIVVDANLTVLVGVTNSNPVSVLYDPTTAEIMYRGHKLGEAHVGGGRQPARSRQVVRLQAILDGAEAAGLGPRLLRDALLRRVPLRVCAALSARVDLGALRPICRATMECDLMLDPMALAVVDRACVWKYGL